MRENTYAIIMAGGNGERFWPLSTPECPKQFLDLFEGKALIRHAVDRLDGLIPADRIFVITSKRFVQLTRNVLPQIPGENIIGEPCRRDTAAAVAVACGLVLKKGGANAVGCVLTADHLIRPIGLFQQTLLDAIEMAIVERAIITMGIVPTRPETGFGYIACGDLIPVTKKTTFCKVTSFVEKPNLPTAKMYLAQGNYLWNSGMFIWQASTMQRAYEQYAGDFSPVIDAVMMTDDISDVLNPLYNEVRSISLDYAVMEHFPNILVARAIFDWDDVGSWNAVANHFPKDDKGNVKIGNVVTHGAANNVLVDNRRDHILAVMGMEDVVVVETAGATLVCPKSQLVDMKRLVGLVR